MAHDLFISYAEADRAWVDGYLLDALERAGVQYHSEDAFALGVPRLLEFERAVQDSKRTLLILTPAYLASNFSQFVDLLGQTYGMETATWPVVPLILHQVKLPPRLAMLEALDGVDPATWPAVLDRLCAALQRPVLPPPPPPACPYPGMLPFREADSARFFGRDQEIQEMIGRLRTHPVMAVIGPSGSGKSSLVLAGLLPALRKSRLFGPSEWNIRVMRPGDAPLEMLARTLADLPGSMPAGARTEAVSASNLVLAEGARLLLVIDQFEETFTLAGTSGLPFQRELLRLAHEPGCYVVLTVRADFYPDLMAAPMWRSIQAHRLEVVPLDEDGLKAAIMQPAENAGVFVEAALVERLLADGAGEPGILPLIQETLVLIWEQLDLRFLPLRAYDALVLTRGAYGSTAGGGRTGLQVAMARRADATLAELAPEQQAITRRIFLRLIAFGEGRADTRRQQPVAALRSSASADPALFETTLRHLTDSRLLTLSGEEGATDRKVDIAHESLIAGWPTLYSWLNERRESEQVRRRLDDKAQEWLRLGRGDGGLLDEIELSEAQRWLDSPAAQDMGYDPALLELMTFSRATIEQAALAKEQARQRELAQAQALAEEQQRRAEEQARSAGRLRRLVAVLAAVLLLACGSAVFAYSQKLLADKNEATAERNANSAATNAADALRNANTAVAEKGRANQNEQQANANASTAVAEKGRADQNLVLAQANAATAVTANMLAQAHSLRSLSRLALSQAAYFRDKQFDLSLLLDLEAQQIDNYAESRSGLLTGLEYSPHLVKYLRRGDDAGSVGAFSADGETLATSQCITMVFLESSSCAGWGLVFSDPTSGDTAGLAPVKSDASAVIALGGSPITSMIFSPDDSILMIASADGTIIRWDMATKALGERIQLPPTVGAAASLAFKPGGGNAILAATFTTSTVTLLDLGANPPLQTRPQLQAGARPGTIEGSTITSVALSPDGTTLAVGLTANERADGEILVWDVVRKRLKFQTLLRGHSGQVISLAFSPDGALLTSGSTDHTIQLWDLSKNTPSGQSLRGHNSAVRSLAFNGTTLIAWSSCIRHSALCPGEIGLWDVKASEPLGRRLSGHTGAIASVALSSDGHLLASGGADQTIQIWDLTASTPISTVLSGVNGAITALAFSPNGALLISGSADGTLVLWDIKAHQALSSLSPDPLQPVIGFATPGVISVAFSSDGSTIATSSCVSHDQLAPYNCAAPDIHLWNVAGQRLDPLAVLHASTRGDATSLAFSPDGATLAAGFGMFVEGGPDVGAVTFWDIASQQPLSPTLSLPQFVWSVAYSPDGKTIATGGNVDGTIRLWDVATGQQLGLPLTGHSRGMSPTDHSGGVTSVMFSPDGKMLASSGDDATVRLWDVASHVQVGPALIGDPGRVSSVAFSPDGRTVASGGDGATWLWDADIASWRARACAIANRNLTKDESLRILGDDTHITTCQNLPAGN